MSDKTSKTEAAGFDGGQLPAVFSTGQEMSRLLNDGFAQRMAYVRRAIGSAPPAPRSGEYLLVCREGSPPSWHTLTAGMTVGRSRSADLQIQNSFVSGEHLQLTFSEPCWEVRDLDSRNGLWINGIQSRAQALTSGDCIALGDVVLVYLSL